MKLDYKNIFLIIISSVMIGLAYNFLNSEGISLIKEERVLKFENKDWQNPNTLISKSEDNKTQPSFSEPILIKLPRAYELYKQDVMFIDARTTEEFEEGHIKYSINIPFYNSEEYQSILNTLDKNKTIVIYCSGIDCELSIMLGDELFEKGFKKIYIFYGGWNDWNAAGYPVETYVK